MKRKTQPSNLLAWLTAASLLFGFSLTAFSFCTPRQWPAPTSLPPKLPTPTASPTAAPAAQIVVLVLGVDSHTSLYPQLESVWVVSFAPGTSTYFFVGVSPDSIATYSPTEPPASLRQVYELDTQMARGNEFMRDALHDLLPGLAPPQGEVTYDRDIFRQAVDILDGLNLNGQIQSGQDILDLWEALPNDPLTRLEFEEQVLSATLTATQDHKWTPANVLAYFDLGQIWNPSYDDFVKLSQMAPSSLNFTYTVHHVPLKGEDDP
jgi:hypothetical protein